MEPVKFDYYNWTPGAVRPPRLVHFVYCLALWLVEGSVMVKCYPEVKVCHNQEGYLDHLYVSVHLGPLWFFLKPLFRKLHITVVTIPIRWRSPREIQQLLADLEALAGLFSGDVLTLQGGRVVLKEEVEMRHVSAYDTHFGSSVKSWTSTIGCFFFWLQIWIRCGVVLIY
jgi:hypothetical protein